MFSYTSENGTLHFSAQARKTKEIHPGKIYHTSGNENPEKVSYISGGNQQSPKIKNFSYFCYKEANSSKLKYFLVIII